MGGSAYLIHGDLDPERLRPRAAPRTLLDRVLLRQRFEAPRTFSIGTDRTITELPAAALESMAPAFREYVASHLSPPWPATRVVLDYLAIRDVMKVYLRGQASGTQTPEWYLQFTFSGCAGLAQVSAETAAHWVRRWFLAERAEICARFLTPFGFTPADRVEADGAPLLVPMGSAGYASCMPSEGPANGMGGRLLGEVDIDASALEARGFDEHDEVLRRLQEDLRRIAPVDRCFCQWCAPNFDHAATDSLLPTGTA